jgi:hypothetical protein
MEDVMVHDVFDGALYVTTPHIALNHDFLHHVF